MTARGPNPPKGMLIPSGTRVRCENARVVAGVGRAARALERNGGLGLPPPG